MLNNVDYNSKMHHTLNFKWTIRYSENTQNSFKLKKNDQPSKSTKTTSNQ